jgi:hypothetical protein
LAALLDIIMDLMIALIFCRKRKEEMMKRAQKSEIDIDEEPTKVQ